MQLVIEWSSTVFGDAKNFRPLFPRDVRQSGFSFENESLLKKKRKENTQRNKGCVVRQEK